MADHSLIEWTDATWNPVTGCSLVSPGCTNCYAMQVAGTRLAQHPSRAGLTRPSKIGPVWNGEVRLNEGWLTQPLQWRKPRRIFVCAHGDLFHESVPDEWIDRVFAVMALAPQHTFQVLTKRSTRMRAYVGSDKLRGFDGHLRQWAFSEAQYRVWIAMPGVVEAAIGCPPPQWPLPNVWLGVSAEDQRRADERVPDLLATPAAVRFVSAEPLLGPIDFMKARQIRQGELYPAFPALDWIIVGGESGPGARPMQFAWETSIRRQCEAAGTAYFRKQWGEWIDASVLAPNLYRSGWRLNRDLDVEIDLTKPLNFDQAAALAEALGRPYEHHSDGSTMIRMGKKASGRLLDGVEHSGMPEARHG